MNSLFNQDCSETLKTLENNSIDALITDPPAGISFMGKSWDSDKGGRDEWIKWMCGIMKECHRVMKPGAHGLVWSIPRTSHWTATALENAGFEIRDVVHHIFGSGFPKSLNISKAIDKALEEKKENQAKQWSGWGTALKPAVENWILIRKPIAEKTVAKNVLAHGCGGINIDACRIGTETRINKGVPSYKGLTGTFSGQNEIPTRSDKITQGRFPANLVFSHDPECEETCSDECAVKMLDDQAGICKTGNIKPHVNAGSSYQASKNITSTFIADNGSNASRFFYCAKVSPKERNAGLEEMPDREGGIKNSSGRGFSESNPMKPIITKNHHPTVKPQKLMRYLCKLITPSGGVVLDPFMGSGSTGMAALAEGFQFVGIESEQEYYDIAKKRIEFSIDEYLIEFNALHKNNGGK